MTTIFLLSFVVFCAAFAALATGVLAGRGAFERSCGADPEENDCGGCSPLRRALCRRRRARSRADETTAEIRTRLES